MAWVYEATRASGEFHQRVAVKVLPAPFGGAMLDRFRREKSILAGLNHPGIAHLLDGGITENGISYLAMEFVEGVPITSYGQKAATLDWATVCGLLYQPAKPFSSRTSIG